MPRTGHPKHQTKSRRRPAPDVTSHFMLGSGATARCVDRIAAAIGAGELDTKGRLSEASIAARFGEGLSSVRSAFQVLSNWGILERRARSGTYIRTPSIAEYVERVCVRAHLESLAARAGCWSVSDAQVQHLRRLASEADAQWDQEDYDVLRMGRVERDFHRQLVKVSGLEHLVELFDREHFLLQTFYPPAELAKPLQRVFLDNLRDIPSHRDLVDSLARRDPNAHERAVRRHALLPLHHYFAGQPPTGAIWQLTLVDLCDDQPSVHS